MRAVLQRVASAAVKIEGETMGQIDNGLLILLGIHAEDTEEDLNYLVEKIVHMRIFEDENKKMNLSLLDVDGSALVVSQFTLYADTRRGRRPGFSAAAAPEMAEPMYRKFCEALKAYGVPVATGRFGADMDVELCNRGPVTIILDSEQRLSPRR
ncbi:MAG: D-tyrosyl-tRNA(Tyr) deacylase [Firmicutes bacterium]|nr:D-tyrosyl-tRNA(Tyr) deacylase [Bacillota bacterium]